MNMHTAPTITDLENNWQIVDWPAFTYIQSTDPEQAIIVDGGARHLGEKTPGVAVPFPTTRYGELHKHFGIGEDEAGNVYAYGKAVSVTSTHGPKQTLAAARIGSLVNFRGKTYRIRQTPNKNIALDPVTI